jgi:hypothetical protein
MIGFIINSKLGRYAALLVGFLVTVFGLIQYGKMKQRKEDEVQDLKDYVETKEKIDEVAPSNDRSAAIDRLRGNGVIRKSDLFN